MQGRKLMLPIVVLIMLSLIATSNVGAQSAPKSNRALPPTIEVCFGTATGTIEFVCKDENHHYRAIDCDEVNGDTRECLSGECTITKGNDCASIRSSYEDSSNNEPQCSLCTTIFAPVYN
ncbi:MAG: hypothetical protein M3O68_06910 [Thermoproteota archaeon]|nr:hypothetical protein [Thermoproteota archaeon]